MRTTLLMSAAMFGLAVGVPAFAQTTMTTTVPSASGSTGAGTTMGAAPAGSGAGSMGVGSMTGSTNGSATTAMPAPHRPMHARRTTMMNGDQGQLASSGMVRPGHEPGVGNSEPSSTQASNIDRADTRSPIAPRLPAPSASLNASPEQLLGAAQQDLRRGRTGAAQEALERAETRVLDRSTQAGAASQPDTNPMIQAIGDARRSLANHDIVATQRAISTAIGSNSFAQGTGSAGGMNGGTGMSGGAGMSGAPMTGGGPMVGQAPTQAPMGNSAYSPPSAPGTNALVTTGATNGNAIGATTGGPSQANGIPGTPNGISGQTGSNAGGGSSGTGGAGGSSGGAGTGK